MAGHKKPFHLTWNVSRISNWKFCLNGRRPRFWISYSDQTGLLWYPADFLTTQNIAVMVISVKLAEYNDLEPSEAILQSFDLFLYSTL